jgi:hypothetical protein
MKTRRFLVDAFHAAMRTEQQLWEQMGGKGPGQPGFDQALWDRWLEAVGQTTAAPRALREAFAEPDRTAAPTER